MQEAHESPAEVDPRDKLISEQAAKIAELTAELEKVHKLVSSWIHGHRSEKRIPSSPNQRLLPFETEEEFQAARREAQAWPLATISGISKATIF